MNNQFYVTRDLFKEYTGYDSKNPLSYEEWDELPSEYKAAVLYLQFFDQITLAWYKCCKNFSQTDDGVSEVLQYLNKNVPIIEKDPKRFSAAYIYRVSYNCLSCVCWEDGKHGKIYKNEYSNVVQSGEDELDLFDTVVGYSDLFEEYIHQGAHDYIWPLIEDLGQDTVAVVSQLLGEKSRKAARMKEEKKAQIVEELRSYLEAFTEVMDF